MRGKRSGSVILAAVLAVATTAVLAASERPAAAAGAAVPTISPPPAVIGPGEVVHSAVFVTNTGDATAAAGTATARWVPSNTWANLTVTGTSANCSTTTVRSVKTATCSYPALAPGASAWIATVDVTAPDPVPYSGIVFPFTFSTAAGSSTVTYDIRGSGPADLVGRLTVTPMPMTAGSPAQAKVVVENLGYTPASAFVTRVALPSGTTGATVTGATCTAAGDVLDCPIPSLPNGGYLSFTVSFTAPPSVGTSPVTVTVDADGAVPEADESNNVVATPVGVVVAMSAPPDPIGPGGSGRSLVFAGNTGTAASAPGTVTLRWPKSLPSGTSVTVAGAAGTCTVTTPRGSSTRIATCPLPSIAPGATALVAGVTVRAPATVPFAGIDVVVTTYGPVDTASARFRIRGSGPADLYANLVVTPNPVLAGRAVTATASIANWGYSDAPAFGSRIALPAGATGIDVTPDPGTTCTVSGTVVDCLTDGLPAGRYTIVTIGYDAPLTAGSALSLFAVDVTGTVPEASETNNGAGHVLTVNGTAANLTTSIVNPAAPVPQGGTFTREITVTNIGSAPATDVLLTDQYRTFTFVSGSGPSGTTCSAWYVTVQFNRRIFNGAKCSLGTIPAGGSVTVQIVVGVPATTAAGTYTDTANASTSAFRDPAMNATSTGTTTVFVPSTPLPPTNSVPPAVSGIPVQGNSLSATAGTWIGAAPITYAYEWQRCDASATTCSAIPGATAATYTLQAADVGSRVRVRVVATNAGGSTAAESAPTEVVAAPAAPVNTVPPALVAGEDWPGSTWGVTTGTWTGTQPITYAYQWQRCDPDTLACTDIVGATSAAYTLTAADVGWKVRARVTATNTGGSASAVSETSGEILPGPG